MNRCRLFCHNQGIYRWIYTSDNTWRRCSPIILWMSVLRCCKVEFIFFLSGFFSRIFAIDRTAGEGEAISLWLALSVALVSWYVFSIPKSSFTGCLRILLVYAILTIAYLISESLLGNTRVIMAILHKCLWSFS